MSDANFDSLNVTGLSNIGEIRINDNALWLRGGTDPNHGIRWCGEPNKRFAGQNIDGPIVFGCSGGALGTHRDNVDKIALTWDGFGNINVTGDVKLVGADCAEDFDVACSETVEVGTVMVIDENGALRPSEHPYDKRVAGVISGGGDLKPGIVLDRKSVGASRLPLGLLGKVYCKVDANPSPIEVGDLLTTSSTLGHAMKAADPTKAFGAVLGKALRRLEKGRGVIPMLITLQ
jgi:hypothetical protein